MYTSADEQQAVTELLNAWNDDSQGTKNTFLACKELLESMADTTISFHGRPGITYSLRGSIAGGQGEEDKLFTMVDIIDDDPANRWLSICFYGDMITDSAERGDFVPGGLLGEDATCFDYDSHDDELQKYISQRISEAHAFCIKS